MRTPRFALVLIACVLSLRAWPQEEIPATIVSEGKGSINVAPAVMTFEIETMHQADSFAAAAEPLADFEARLRTALEEANLKPLELSVGGLLLAEIDLVKTAIVAATIRFDTAPLSNAESPAKELAARVDQINSVAATIADGKITGPTFEAADPQAAEQNAISRATENALYRADAVATLMESRIYAVQSVRIRDVQWLTSETAASAAQAPSLQNITCQASVEVEYLYAPY